MLVHIFKKSLLTQALLILLPVVLHAQVAEVVFTTDPQTILPNELSSPITIQTRDSLGNLYQTPETIDLEFVSTSVTAEFLGSTGNPVTKTMNINTANRTFYYRDLSQGTFTINVKATGRNSGYSWNANQVITVSNSTSTPTPTDQTKTIESGTSPNSSNQNTQNVTSSHYSATSLTTFNSKASLTVDAGRDRLGSVGSPLEFKAEANIETTRDSNFKWNFGDGREGYGRVLSHTYEYPGEYVVILNATFSGGQAVARVNVKIVEPDILIVTATPEKIEVKNNSNYEVNLFGRVLVVGDNFFPFPKDTIVKAKQSIIFSQNLTNLRPNGIYEVSVVVLSVNVNEANLALKIKEQKSKQISKIYNEVSNLQKQLSDLSSEQESIGQIKVSSPSSEKLIVEENIKTEDDLTQTALVVNTLAKEKDSSIIGNWFQTLKRFFLRKQ